MVHIAHVREGLTLLNNAEVTLNLQKCRFFSETVDNHGHIIPQRCLKIASYTTDAIQSLELTQII